MLWYPKPGETLHDAFKSVKKKIIDTNWNEFARSPRGLNIGDDLDEIIHDYQKNRGEQKNRMLQRWESNNGPNASVENLYKIMNKFLNLDDGVPTSSVQPSSSLGDTNGPAGNQRWGIQPTKHVTRSKQSQSDVTDEESSQRFSTDQRKVFSEGMEATAKVVTEEEAVKSEFFSESSSSEQECGDESSKLVTDTKMTRIPPEKSGEKMNKPDTSAFNFCRKFVPSIPPANKDFYDKHLNDTTIYPIRSNPKGCVLILNNRFEWNPGSERKGSEMDVANMETMWRNLGCDLLGGQTHQNKTGKKMLKLITRMTRLGKGTYDFIAIVVMTHGGILEGEEKTEYDRRGRPITVKGQSEECFYGDDNDPVRLQDVLWLFNNENASNLQNIPKLIFLQCCRGQRTDKGIVTDSDPHVPGDTEKSGLRIPTISDILVAFPTHFGNTALRNETYGSWYINAIANVFTRYAGQEHVVDMLTRVNDSMASMTGNKSECKAMSNFQSSLRRKLYFFPGFPTSVTP